MASTVDLVIDNFCYHIEAIVTDKSRSKKGFEWFDEDRLNPEDTAGCTRWYNVRWLGEEPQPEDEGVTDITERIAVHQFQLDILYPNEIELKVRQKMMLKDRHAVIKKLRHHENFVGYSDKQPATNIGLWRRALVGVEAMTETEKTTTLRMTWECTIKESE